MTIKDTLFLQDEIMKKYCNSDTDKEIITALCLARNIAEVVKGHFEKTNNKSEFYRSVLNDESISFSMGYKTLEKYYAYLKEE